MAPFILTAWWSPTKIARRWSPGCAFQEAGAALVAANRAYLSDTITIQWIKGHRNAPTPPLRIIAATVGHLFCGSLTKNPDISSLPHSPILVLRIHSISLREFLSKAIPPDIWQWADQECSPPLGCLRSTLSYHRVLASRSNRDHIRARRGGAPIWLASHQSVKATSWFYHGQPLGKLVRQFGPYGIFVGMEKIEQLQPGLGTRR